MIDMNHMKSRLRRALCPAETLAAIVLLLCAFPAAAALSGAIGAGGAGHSLKETLAETADNFSEMVSAFIDGDDEKVTELMGEVAKTPGKLIKRAFPVLEAPHAVADKLKAAKQKIERFVGGVKHDLVDTRAALAIGGDNESGGWSDASLLAGEPLQFPTDTTFTAPSHDSPAKASTATDTASSWDFEQWVIAKQAANPHCYGVVDLETLPPECFGGTSTASPDASQVENSAQAKATDWAASDWTAEGDGWSGWDTSDLRYSDADRDAARVGVFAANCWGVYGVSESHGLFELMRTRMQRNNCPNEETNQASSDEAGSGYADALADVLDDGSAAATNDDYLSALDDLEAQEAERLRLEEEERERQARLDAEEERERQAQLAQQREFNRQAAQQLGEALGGLIRAYSGDGTASESGASSIGAGDCQSKYGKPPPGYVYIYYENKCGLRADL